MSGDLPIGQTFGNYLVHGISEIKAPDPIPWTPEAPGWMAVWIVLLSILVWMLFRSIRKWHGNAYRRAALFAIRKLQGKEEGHWQEVLSALPGIIKYAALHAYPRVDVAALSGDKWIDFLQSRYPGEGFNREAAEHLVAIAYQTPEKWGVGEEEAVKTIRVVKNWIRLHDRGNGDA